jgi:4,5-dihydroxyphthalate decarboxylase
MSRLKLTVAFGEYDYLQPLIRGEVEPEGLDLNLLTEECGIRHRLMNRHAAYDASEYSMGAYLVARSRGVDRFEAIPFFTRRMFFHRFLFVHRDSDIQRMEDLKGRRIGILSHQNSLAIFIKAFLMHGCGIDQRDVTWVAVNRERVPMTLPDGVASGHDASGRNLEDLLLDECIDVMASPDLPASWLNGGSQLRRLFPAYETEEVRYHQETGLFPLMHPVVFRREVLERHPWAARSLYDALAESRRQHNRFLQQPHRTSFAWPPMERERQIFGDDPFVQGFQANRHDVSEMIRFAGEQGLIDGELEPEDIFRPELLDT